MSSGFDTRILFPKTYLRAIDLDGKDVTVEIAAVKNEPLPGEDDAHLVLSFVGKKKTLGLNVTNRMCLEKMFGFLTDAWLHKRITFGPTKREKAADGIGILIKGSPDITESFTVTVTKYLPTVKLVPTGNAKPPASVDPVTGEVDDDAPHAAEGTQRPQDGVETLNGTADAFTGPDAASGGSDEEPPGRGALFDTDDPDRPATTGDKKLLSEAIAHAPTEWAKAYRKRFGGRSNSELTHGEIVAFTAAAVKEALA